MKVLYIHQYFKTPAEGGGLRSYYLAKELVKEGIQVTVITARNEGQRIRKDVEGIDVIYLPVAYANEMSFGQRYWAFLKFMTLAMIESCRHRKVDLCYVMTTPLTTGFVAMFNKFILALPYIFEVGDIWPKVPIDMGLIQSGFLKRVLLYFERVFYTNAKGLIGLSEPITAHLHELSPDTPRETIFNISDCSRFFPEIKDQKLAKKYGVVDQFVLSYTGTFGFANDLSRFVELAESVQDLPILFLLVGGGAEHRKIESMVESTKLNNIRIYGPMDHMGITEVFNITDAMFVSFADVPSLHTGSPNKFFDALAAGKPVITNFRGWVGELIEEAACGFVAESVEIFRQNLESLIANPELTKTQGGNARKLAEDRFDLPVQSRRQIEFIRSLIN